MCSGSSAIRGVGLNVFQNAGDHRMTGRRRILEYLPCSLSVREIVSRATSVDCLTSRIRLFGDLTLTLYSGGRPLVCGLSGLRGAMPWGPKNPDAFPGKCEVFLTAG